MSGRQVKVWDIEEAATLSNPHVGAVPAGAAPSLRQPTAFTRWAIARARMEARLERRTPDGRRSLRPWELFDRAVHKAGVGLWCLGLYERGVRNALDIRVNRIELGFPHLPAAFDGYTVLHLTDLHIDGLPGLAERLRALFDGVAVDLCVMTGDYRFRKRGPYQGVIDNLAHLLDGIATADGVLATLGNHDSVEMVEPLESIGVRVLVNETASVARGNAAIHLTGVDDVHNYYSDEAHHALGAMPDGFRIGLVHSPELAQAAADAGIALYLTGHTHGGQVCLPGGRPIIRNLTAHKEFCAGLWQCGPMVGYTSAGAGVSCLPVRFNSRGEATLFTLRRAAR
ncbi:MAG: metallophosphoesterase [Rhodospirillaceae bacterium]